MPMPRLTDHPSGMSCARRAASASRSSGCQLTVSLILSPIRYFPTVMTGLIGLARSSLVRRVAGRNVDEAIDVDAGSGDFLGRQLAQFRDVLGLRDCQLRC